MINHPHLALLIPETSAGKGVRQSAAKNAWCTENCDVAFHPMQLANGGTTSTDEGQQNPKNWWWKCERNLNKGKLAGINQIGTGFPILTPKWAWASNESSRPPDGSKTTSKWRGWWLLMVYWPSSLPLISIIDDRKLSWFLFRHH